MKPEDAKERAGALFRGAMRGRTMYVVPYLMGPAASPYCKVGVEITDSPYVVASMYIMARIGRVALDRVGNSEEFVPGLHSLGDLNPDRRYVLHFPEEKLIWSIGSGYGGNALLGKKCFALRIASWMAREQSWMAEHMLIVGLTGPSGKTMYIAAAFPSACGKTNPNVMAARRSNAIFTNLGLTPSGEPWWEGMDAAPPAGTIDWLGRPHTGGSEPVAQANSRYTVPAGQTPSISPRWEDPEGVPISAFLFGGRRARVAPLVYEARDWQHGVFVAATMASETTAAITGQVGVTRRDPMAMLPFCGYNMGRYFGHWLEMGRRIPKPPRIFHVNWFRKGADGKFLWPGYGENVRVLKWVMERVEGTAAAAETPIGLVPARDALTLDGLNISRAAVDELLRVDPADWTTEADATRKFFERFGNSLPQEIRQEQEQLHERLARVTVPTA